MRSSQKTQYIQQIFSPYFRVNTVAKVSFLTVLRKIRKNWIKQIGKQLWITQKRLYFSLSELNKLKYFY